MYVLYSLGFSLRVLSKLSYSHMYESSFASMSESGDLYSSLESIIFSITC